MNGNEAIFSNKATSSSDEAFKLVDGLVLFTKGYVTSLQ